LHVNSREALLKATAGQHKISECT